MPEILAEVQESIDITATVAATPGSLTDDYNDLQNHPSINGVELVGNKTTGDLGIEPLPGSITPEMFAPDTQDDMVVGLAKNLVATTGTTNATPYTFRASPGGSVAELHRLIGGTLGWNQQIITTEKSGSVTPSGSTYYSAKYLTGSATIGHVYFMSAMFAYSGSGTDVNPFLQAGTSKRVTTTLSSTKKLVQMLQKATGQTTLGLGITTGSGGRTLTSSDAWSYDDAIAIDITQMFGSTMADAIATMETTTAGSGVAFFRSLFPSAYYPYSAPTMQSVQTSARVARGFNQWDEEWEVGSYGIVGVKTEDSTRIRSKNFIPILPNTQYCSTISGYFYEYDENKQFISRAERFGNTTFTTGTGSCYMTFHTYTSYGTTYKYDITIGFSVPEMLGVYVPYEAKTYLIDDVVLRGIPKLTSGQLKYDGDFYLPSGQVTRRYGVATFDGTETLWGSETVSGVFSLYIHLATIGKMQDRVSGTLNNEQCRANNFLNVSTTQPWQFTVTSNYIIFRVDSTITTVAEWKTWLGNHPQTVLYPLATPTTEQADPYAEIQTAGETEQFVSDNYIPVGNESFYPTDLTNVVQNLAPLPTSAGTYKLQVTVTGGVPSYSWVAG